MKIRHEATCSICKRFFCCAKCREKHEIKKHAIRIAKNHVDGGKEQSEDSYIYAVCPICLNKPFPLHEVIYIEMLDHIRRHHLPLHCQKCAKVYTKIEDISEFSKCVPQISHPTEGEHETQPAIEPPCVLGLPLKSNSLQNNISTQTSPHLAREFNGTSSLTPIAVVNLQWQAKVKATHNISDSASSFKNLSVINNSTSTQSDAKGKLVRSTSTPVHAEANHPKPKEQTFNATGGQVSSIYSSGNESENHNSPITTNIAGGSGVSAQPHTNAVNPYRKLNGRPKVAAVTPLRHVMSKSIQKAFAEHGLSGFSEQKLLNSKHVACAMSESLPSSPLDLRLSPALRRSRSDNFYTTRIKYTIRETKYQKQIGTAFIDHQSPHKRIISTGKRLKTETLMITAQTMSSYHKSADESGLTASSTCTNSVYKTCQSFELTSTQLGIENVSDNNEATGEMRHLKLKHPNVSNLASITPTARLSGNSINKIAIQFKTPDIKNKSKFNKTPEIFYTPKSPPLTSGGNNSDDLSKSAVVQNLSARFSPSRRSSMSECAQSTAFSHCESDLEAFNDEVFLEKPETDWRISNKKSKISSGGFLKSIVDSVMWLPSLTERPHSIVQRRAIHDKPNSKISIIKRCASIAGSLVRSSSLIDEKQLNTLKRKRTYTIDGHLSPYKTMCGMKSVSSLNAAATEQDLSSTKRFRIQGRKPIERMRNASS